MVGPQYIGISWNINFFDKLSDIFAFWLMLTDNYKKKNEKFWNLEKNVSFHTKFIYFSFLYTNIKRHEIKYSFHSVSFAQTGDILQKKK